MELIFIRHGETAGNLEKRYIGTSDEGLCQEGKVRLLAGHNERYPAAWEVGEVIYCSPMKRCLETAKLLYPEKKIRIIEQFKEMDFGLFEGKNYVDLMGNEAYQRWIDTGGTEAFPKGEDRAQFEKRCVCALEKCIREQILIQGEEEQNKKQVFIVHGGTIMAFMHGLGDPVENFYTYQCKNGCGISCNVIVTDTAHGNEIKLKWNNMIGAIE